VEGKSRGEGEKIKVSNGGGGARLTGGKPCVQKVVEAVKNKGGEKKTPPERKKG